MSKPSKLSICEHCGAEIAVGAKVCPKCGGKNQKPIYKRPWFIVLMVVIVLGVIGSVTGNCPTANTPPAVSNAVKASAPTESFEAPVPSESAAPEVSYTPYTVAELKDDLDTNALKASDKYKNQYVELTGRLNVIDSSGKYISIVPTDDDFAIVGVHCNIKTDDQKAVIMGLSIGDSLVIKGKITNVGEVLGYFLDIDEITKAED